MTDSGRMSHRKQCLPGHPPVFVLDFSTLRRLWSTRAVRPGVGTTLAVLAVAVMFVCACETGSKPNEPEATKKQPAGESYGDGVKRKTSVSISDILANPEQYEGRAVRVEGTVTDVCPMRGCWFEIAQSGTGDRMQFKVNDGVMEFPMTAVGKYAVAEGVVRVRKLSLEETRRFAAHLAEEKGEELDPTTITEPQTLVQLAGTGAVIREGK